MPQNYVIIGSGPAGVAAAQAIQGKDANANLALLCDDNYGFYSRPGLAYYLTGEVPERQLFLRQAANFQLIKTRATAIYPQEHKIVAGNNHSYTYDSLLLATGSSASKIAIPGIDLRGVVKLDNFEDAKNILKAARKCKSAVVTGGGITALELVEGLVTHGIETHYVVRSDRYWPNVLDEVESAIVEKRLKEHGVKLHRKKEIARIIGKQNKVVGIETDKGDAIKCQIVAVAIGVQPRLELAKSADLKIDRGVLTDEYMQTSSPGIYAAGDIVQAFDPLTGKTAMDSLWGNAIVQGRLAGMNMAGERIPFRKGVPFNITRLAGLTTTIIGTVGKGKDDDLLTIAHGDSETWRQLPNVMAVQWDSEVNRTRMMVGTNCIMGALVMGDQTLSRPLYELTANRVDITSIRAALSSSPVESANAIIDFWLKWSGNGKRPY